MMNYRNNHCKNVLFWIWMVHYLLIRYKGIFIILKLNTNYFEND